MKSTGSHQEAADHASALMQKRKWKSASAVLMPYLRITPVDRTVAALADECVNRGSWIAFHTRGNSIAIVRPDGSDFRRVTEAGIDSYPLWSPNGRHIAFNDYTGQGHDLRVTDISGNTTWCVSCPEEQLDAFHFVWKPSGRLFYRHKNGCASSVASDGSDTRLEDLAPWKGQIPSWSPDGTRSAFVLRETLYLAKSDGSDSKALTQIKTINFAPLSWSPDSGRVVVTAWGGKHSKILMVDLQTISIERLSGEDNRSWPSWSPDGRRIVYWSAPTFPNSICVIPSVGGTPYKIGPNEHETDPRWGPIIDEV